MRESSPPEGPLLGGTGLHTERTVGAGDEEEASVYEADAEIGALKTVVVWEFSAW